MAKRVIHPPRGTDLTCKNWLIEAPYRMIQHNLDPEVAGDPDNLIVYGGRGRAARNWVCFDAILDSLRNLEPDETLLVQSGKPVAIFGTHEDAPRVIIANTNIVPAWATQENFDRWEAEGLIMYGQMTAGSWIYIGTQGILQGTYETLAAAAKKHFGPHASLKGKFVLTADVSVERLVLQGDGGVSKIFGDLFQGQQRAVAASGIDDLHEQDFAGPIIDLGRLEFLLSGDDLVGVGQVLGIVGIDAHRRDGPGQPGEQGAKQ